MIKTKSEISFVSLIGVLGRPGRGVGKISSSTNSLFPESNFKFLSIRLFVWRMQRVFSTVASAQFVVENLFIKLGSAPLWVSFY